MLGETSGGDLAYVRSYYLRWRASGGDSRVYS